MASFSTPDTVHIDELYRRPPPPYELEGSRMRFVHFPRVAGAIMITVGTVGSLGFNVTVVVSADVGLESQVVVVSAHNARTSPGLRVMGDEGMRREDALVEPLTEGNEMLTVVELSQEHVDSAAFMKLNSSEQFHTARVIPPLSVGASNFTMTTCPLSENFDDVIAGAGVAENGDSKVTGVDVLLYCSALGPLSTRDTK